MWAAASQEYIDKVVKKHKNLMTIILNASTNNYEIDDESVCYINDVLEELNHPECLEEVYLLTRLIESRIDTYNPCKVDNFIEKIEALNNNYVETGIRIYPRYEPAWNTGKSERKRARTFNAYFTNYMIVRAGDVNPFKFTAHILHDEGMFKGEIGEMRLRIAVSPVTDAAVFEYHIEQMEQGGIMIVEGVKNEEEVSSRILTTFQELFYKDYSFIIFPEALGTERIVLDMQAIMRQRPDIYTFVLVPTICRNGRNTLTVLGPGGIKFIEQEKVTPFYLQDKDGGVYREYLQYTNEIHILITQEIGNIVFPICADFLDPDYYRVIGNVALADMVLCPSLSPGYQAFSKQLIKGASSAMAGIWINSCSAKSLSRNEKVPEPIFTIQLPNNGVGETLYHTERTCDGRCSSKYCYVDIEIACKRGKFVFEREVKFHCA